MGFNLSFHAFYIFLAFYGLALLFMGFNWIKLLSLIFGMFFGYMAMTNILPLTGIWLNLAAAVIAVGFGFLLFRYHQLMPFILCVAVFYLIVGMSHYALGYEPSGIMQIVFAVFAIGLACTAFFAKDYAIVIWTAINGAILFVMAIGFLSFGTNDMIAIASRNDFRETLMAVFGKNTLYHAIMLVILLVSGLLIQFYWTASYQLFVKKRYKGKHRG